MLLERLLELGAERGIGRTRVQSDGRDEVIRFYRRHGFEPYSVHYARGAVYRPPNGHR